MKIVFNSKTSLLKSILFLIFGALIFAYPNQVVQGAAILFGALLIVYGIIVIIKNNYDTKKDNTTSSSGLVLGITLLVVGLLFIVLNQSISQIIQYVLGAYILFMSIEKLIFALSLGRKNPSFITQLIVAVMLLIAGLYTVLKAHIEIQIIGIIMIIYSIIEIVGYVSSKKDNIFDYVNDFNKDIDKNTIKIKTNGKNIKEAKVIEEKKK